MRCPARLPFPKLIGEVAYAAECANAQHIDPIQRDLQVSNRFRQRREDGVIGPDATIEERLQRDRPIEGNFIKIGRCSGGRQCSVDG